MLYLGRQKYEWMTAPYRKNTLYPEYDQNNARKIEIYHEAGFWEHSNLIITREADLENPELLDGIIERFLLC